MTSTGGIVIVGGGLAATRTAEQLRRSEYTGPITIVSDEDHLPYDRPPLSKEVLRAETDEVALKPAEFYDENDITVLLGAGATALDTAAERLKALAEGTSGADRLIRPDCVLLLIAVAAAGAIWIFWVVPAAAMTENTRLERDRAALNLATLVS